MFIRQCEHIPNKRQNLVKRADTRVVSMVFNGVLCHVPLPFFTVRFTYIICMYQYINVYAKRLSKNEFVYLIVLQMQWL